METALRSGEHVEWMPAPFVRRFLALVTRFLVAFARRSQTTRSLLAFARRSPTARLAVMYARRSWDARRIARSGLFDLKWYQGYVGTGKVLQLSPKEAIAHYISTGVPRGLNPNPLFDTNWYLRKYPDVASAGVNPLVHFIRCGAREMRNPSEQFNTAWYKETYPEVVAAGFNPLAHFLRYGEKEGRFPRRVAANPNYARRLSCIKNRILPSDGECSQKRAFALRSLREAALDLGWTEKKMGAPPAYSFHDELRVKVARETPKQLAFPSDPFMISASKVVVVGRTRHLIIDDKTVVSDEIEHFFDDMDVVFKGSAGTRSGKRQVTIDLIRGPGNIIEQGIHLLHEYAHNYFHVVTEILPRLVLVNSMSCAADIPLLLDEGLEKNFRGMIEMLGQGRDALYLDAGKAYTVGKLKFPCDVSSVQDIYSRPRRAHETVLHIGLIRQAVEQILSSSGFARPSPRRRRFYLRRGARYRALLNEAEIEEQLVDWGFELLSTDGLSINAQIRLFREAEVIIAPTGAALTNIVWCQQGTPVVVLASNHPAMPTEIWTQLGMVSRCSVEALHGPRAFNNTGPFDMHDDYRVPLEEVAGRVAALGYC
jgi:capsular polysaccharide biosynthesis protein